MRCDLSGVNACLDWYWKGFRAFWLCNVVILILTLAPMIGCDSASENQKTSTADSQLSGKLDITGSSTVAPLVFEMAKRFEQRHPMTRIDVQTGGSSRGIADATRGIADIGMASRILTPDESENLCAFAIAQDGVGLIIHAGNPIRELSEEQIKQIYTGQLSNWNQLGGHDQPITVVHKADGRATQLIFLEHLQLDSKSIAAHIVIGDNEQGIKTVATNAGAIGYVSIGAAEFSTGDGVPIRLLPIDGIDATTANVAAGRFPIGRPLLLLTPHENDKLVTAFIEFAQSESVADLVRDLYFVPPMSHDSQSELAGIDNDQSDNTRN